MQLQAGELKGESIKGPLEIESNGTRIVLEDLEGMRTPIRVNATGGSVTMKGLQTETRIDGRDTPHRRRAREGRARFDLQRSRTRRPT